MGNTTVTANGGTITSKASKVPGTPTPRGMGRLAEEQCFYLTQLVSIAFDEAEHLVRNVANKASARLTDRDGTKGSDPLDPSEVCGTLHEAYDCLVVAMNFLNDAHARMRELLPQPGQRQRRYPELYRMAPFGEEPPF